MILNAQLSTRRRLFGRVACKRKSRQKSRRKSWRLALTAWMRPEVMANGGMRLATDSAVMQVPANLKSYSGRLQQPSSTATCRQKIDSSQSSLMSGFLCVSIQSNDFRYNFR